MTLKIQNFTKAPYKNSFWYGIEVSYWNSIKDNIPITYWLNKPEIDEQKDN
jgi:hypothetical protein